MLASFKAFATHSSENFGVVERDHTNQSGENSLQRSGHAAARRCLLFVYSASTGSSSSIGVTFVTLMSKMGTMFARARSVVGLARTPTVVDTPSAPIARSTKKRGTWKSRRAKSMSENVRIT